MVAGRLRGVTDLGQVAPRRKRNTVKKMITAAIGGALFSGALLGAGRPVPTRITKTAPQHGTQEWHRSTRAMTAMRLPASIATRTVSPAK